MSENAAGRSAMVLIASTRAAGGVYPDRTGPLLAEWLLRKGFRVDGPVVVADAEIGPALRQALDGTPGLIVTSGGTGISPTDRTPQATAAVIDYEVPGLAEALRRRGAEAGVPAAVLSRGLAGVANGTLIVNLPGSTGGVKDGMAVLDEVLDHALDQLAGGDHATGPAPAATPAVAPAPTDQASAAAGSVRQDGGDR